MLIRYGLSRGLQVIDKDVQNAFVLPGGHIFVYTGMLKSFRSNHELAAVIGHEMGHVLARHTAEQLERHAAQKESLELQLAEAKEAAVALQDMLATQQQLAEEYREQARRNLLQLKQARLPHTMGMGADAPGAAAGDGEGDVGGDIYAQLQAAREREQQGRRMLQAAALVVS